MSGIIVPDGIVLGGGGGGGGSLPGPTGPSSLLAATEDGTAWRARNFGPIFQEFVTDNLADVQDLLAISNVVEATVSAHGDDVAALVFPVAPAAGYVPMSTGAGRGYTAQPLPIASPASAPTNDGTTWVNTGWLNLSANHVYRLRMTALGSDGAGRSIAIERITIINTGSDGAYTVDSVELFAPVKKGSGWSAEVDGVSPHVGIVDLGGGAGQTAVKGIDGVSLTWIFLNEQLG